LDTKIARRAATAPYRSVCHPELFAAPDMLTLTFTPLRDADGDARLNIKDKRWGALARIVQQTKLKSRWRQRMRQQITVNAYGEKSNE